MVIDDIRKIVEGMLGTLTPAKAQQLAKDMMEPGAAKEQVAKLTADLLEWSQANKDRMSMFARREISDQLQTVGGVATHAELDALKKRVRDLERAAGRRRAHRRRSGRPPSPPPRRRRRRPPRRRRRPREPRLPTRDVDSTLVTRRRLDAELVRRGLATSRTEAQEAVLTAPPDGDEAPPQA